MLNPVRANLAIAVIALLAPPLNALVGIAITPALPGLAAHIGADAGGELFSQMVLALPALMIAIFGLFAHSLARRFGFRNCLASALVAFAVAGVAGIWASDLIALILVRMVLGAAGGVAAALGLSIAADLPPAWKERVLGISAALGPVISLFVLTVGGVLVDLAGWQAPMWFYLLSLSLVPAVMLGLPKYGPRNVDTDSPVNLRDVFRLWPFYVLIGIQSMCFFMVDIQGPFLLQDMGVTSARTIGLATAGYTLTGALSGFSYAWFRERLGERNILVLAPLVLGVGLALIGLSNGIVALYITFFLAGFGVGWICPGLYSAVLTRAQPNDRVMAMGVVYGSIYVGMFANPLLFGLFRATFSLSSIFVLAGFALIALAALLVGTREKLQLAPRAC